MAIFIARSEQMNANKIGEKIKRRGAGREKKSFVARQVQGRV
jgi:hypothetical protein